MKKKRIFILSFILLFLVSTTGLPVTYHLCQMIEQFAAGGLDEYEVCKAEMKKIEPSCCAQETIEYSVKISSNTPVCCQSEFAFNKVKDEFIFNNSDLNFFSSIQNLFQVVTLIPATVNFSSEESFYCDSSPPFLIDTNLHINNSIFLI